MGLTEGFEGYYRPSVDAWKEAYVEGLVVLDTNALLDLYRLSPNARNELFNVLEILRERLFVPHQVAYEFHRRRIDAVQSRRDEFDQAREQIDEQERKVKAVLRRLTQRAHGQIEQADQVQQILGDAFNEAQAFVDRVSKEYDLDPDQLTSGTDDSVLARLVTLLEGKVGSRPTDEMLASDRTEATRRAKEGEPPGFRDAGKQVNAEGDYLWWAEVVRFAKGVRRPVLVVSNDIGKGDWTYDRRGFRIGAHPALVNEIRAATGSNLLLSTTADLLVQAPAFLRVTVSDSTVAETKTLPTADGASTPGRQQVEPEDVLRIVQLKYGEFDTWAAESLIPSLRRGDYWQWQDVRRAAFIKYALNRHIDRDVIRRALPAFSERESAHNQFVVLHDRACWVRLRDLDRYLTELEEEPVLVLDWRPIERGLRMSQATIARNAREESLVIADGEEA